MERGKKELAVLAGAGFFFLSVLGSLNLYADRFSAQSVDGVSNVKKEVVQFFQKTGNSVSIQDVEKLDVKEVYQVATDDGFIFYYLRKSNGDGYVAVGNLFNSKGQNLTIAKKIEIDDKNAEKFYEILNKHKNDEGVIKVGNGKNVEVFAFISTDCPHCRKFYRYLVARKDKVTAHLFLVGSPGKADLVLCKKVSLDEVMKGNYDDVSGKKMRSLLSGCDVKKTESVLKGFFDLAGQVHVDGVPYVVLASKLSGEKKIVRGANISLLESLIKGNQISKQ